MSTTNANCWVQFWENDDYGSGGTYKFAYNQTDGRPRYVNDLSEYYWDGYDEKASNQVDDSTNSLKTGPSTWLYVFSQSRYGGNVLRVEPGATLPDLDDVRAPDGSNWQNTIASFVMYDHKPDCWDTASPTQAADCWVKLYDGLRYTGTCFTLYGAGEVVNNACIDNYRYWTSTVNANGSVSSYYVYRSPDSVVTGPQTWVVLYSDVNYSNVVGQFGPNSLVRNFKDFSSATVMSMKVYEAAPGGFQQSTASPTMIATLQKYQTAAKLESVLGGLIGSIPEVGSMFAGLLGALWPTGPSTAEVWNDMVGYMQAMMVDLINEEALAELNTKLDDYGSAITRYSAMTPGPEKAGQLANILDDLQEDQGDFLQLTDPQQDLTYLLAFGTISVVMLAERAYNYAILSTLPGGTTPPDENATQARENLEKAITELTTAVTKGVQGALQWREGQVKLTDTGGMHTDYEVADNYSGYSVTFSKQEEAEREQKRLQAYVRGQYEELLRAYTIPAGLWGYLTPANTQPGPNPGNPAFANDYIDFPDTVFLQQPTMQTVSVPVSTMANDSNGSNFFIELGTGTVTAVNLAGASGGGLTGVTFTFADGTTATAGQGSGAVTVSATLNDGEVITAMYGGSGTWVDQLYFRTSQGRDFGLGGSGGTDYFGAAPQGTDARLVSMAGTLAYGYISTLTLNWEYQAGKPYQA